MLPGSAPSNPQVQKKEAKDERRKIIIALLFLILSGSCIFCSSQIALWSISRDHIEAGIRSNLRADYGFGPALSLAPLSENIITEASQDEAALLAKQTPIAVGLGIVILPNPIPTPAPTAITLLPTPTLTPTTSAPPNANPNTPAAPTATSVPPDSTPGSTPPPSTPVPSASPPSPPTLPATVLPTVLPPTLPPPTVPPTLPPGTLPPPTVPPTTVPPTSSPPTSSPPTAVPTSPTIAFSAAIFNVNENAGNAVITVILSAASSKTITVNFAANGGTATAGSDYTATSGTLTFAPGSTSQSFSVPIINDTLANEGSETVSLALSNPTNATLGLSSATLTIVDDDTAPSVQFNNPTYSVNEAGGSASIDVTLSAASAVTVTVNYATSDGSATAGSDYSAASSALTFSPGSTSQSFSVPITNDTLDEPDETVNLTLSAAANATLGAPNPATLTIVDDDNPPSVQFGNAAYSVNEGDGTATINVTLTPASGITVTVDYATSDGSAIAGSDYTATSGTLTFAPGSTSQSFSVDINDDALDEPDETVQLSLSNTNNATLGTPTNAALTIVDNDNPGGPCSGIYPGGEPNIGAANGSYVRIACGVDIIVDLTTPINRNNDAAFDVVYYELQFPPPNQILMDQVIMEVGQSPSGPWYQVFNWGDGGPDANTSLGQAGYGTETDNLSIPMTTPPLYGTAPYITGIAIDIDAPLTAAGAPSGSYQYVRISSPAGGGSGNDAPEVDALEVLP